MAETKLGNTTVHTNGALPAVGSPAPSFIVTTKDLADIASDTFLGQRVVLNIFPSIDTPVCATSVREFNKRATAYENVVVLCLSADLPFALGRFCGAEGLDNVLPASVFRSDTFPNNYGVKLLDGALAGLLARAVIVLDEQGTVLHEELVASISDEPNYDAALAVLS